MIKIVGFRSGIWWKKVLAIIVYISFVVTIYLSSTGVTGYNIVFNVIVNILFFIIPFILFANFHKYKNRLPCKIPNIILYIVIYLVSFTAIYLCIANVYFPEEQAYRKIRNANEFSSTGVGIVGIMSGETAAYSRLFESKDVKDIFLKLEKNSTLEGKLYSLCALYYLDFDYYNKEIEKYAIDERFVNIHSGCRIENLKISEVIKHDDPNVVRLNNNTDTLKEWEKRNPQKAPICDFYGGGIPCELKDYILRVKK